MNNIEITYWIGIVVLVLGIGFLLGFVIGLYL